LKRLLPAFVLLVVSWCSWTWSPAAQEPRRFVWQGADNKLTYHSDQPGNRIVDFSHAGYGGGGVPIPDVPVRVVVTPAAGDNTARIQAALDYVAALPADEHGLRGAVLLTKGRHQIDGRLSITSGGVVLRGQGQAADGTVLVARGIDRRPLIRIAGKSDRQETASFAIVDPYVPVGADRLRLSNVTGLKVGATVMVQHPSTAAWIAALGMNKFPSNSEGSWLDWKPGTLDIRWDRVITKIQGNEITLDAPLTSALDATLATSNVSWPGRITQVGVENLRCESEYDKNNPKDEEHAWMAVTLEAAEDAWVSQVTAVHFASSVVSIWETCKRVTVEDCTSLEPVSEIGGYRRHSFYTSGQMTLFQRCQAEHGRHDFVAGYLAAGPNAFVECQAKAALAFSGPLESWASGVLYDNVTMDGGGLKLDNRETQDQGVGWAAANCVLWQCTAPMIVCRKPPRANNWAIGCWGEVAGDGSWQALNEFVKPASLYQAQVRERKGEAGAALKRRTIPAAAGTSPSVDDVAKDLIGRAAQKSDKAPKPLSLQNGWLACDGKLLVGGRMGTVWWRGSVLPSRAGEFGAGVTRFVPGRTGPGYTDDLEHLADTMVATGRARLEHHWGLWYDRRRDDHQMVRRNDGDVWPPFYEQPWSRSGQGTAWDGLSKYDLSKFNPWYFGRLAQFADICDRRGLVLVHQAYFQHNILEAGAHWADFPWRSANCLEDSGFPEPPPYVNKKRIFMADAFYDLRHELRRALHRAYIRHCLDCLGDHKNVIYLTGAEYTGPLEFMQFWIDTISDWEKETGKKVLIGLSCTKDVQDAILADKARAARIAVIDLRFWWYTADGTLYAPKGGESLAPRQQLREWKGNKSRADAQTARQVREYRKRYPDKAILCSLDQTGGWPILAAGGSIPNVPLKDAKVREALLKMQPFEPAQGLTERQWALAEPDHHYLVYSAAGNEIRLDLSGTKETFAAYWIHPRTGDLAETKSVEGGRIINVPTQTSGPCVLWLMRK
jgi:hypothetical protein